jgi:hypothetical protein
MDGDGSDSLKRMASGEVRVGAIGDDGMNGRCRWGTHGVALARLWDSGRGSMRNK